MWPLAASVRGKYLLVSDDPTLVESMVANFSRKSDHEPAAFLAGFNHQRERTHFKRLTSLIDRAGGSASNSKGAERQPQFFSGNMASLSATLGEVSAARIEVRSDGNRVRQTVTYEWLQ